MALNLLVKKKKNHKIANIYCTPHVLSTALSASQISDFVLSGPMNRYYHHLYFTEQVIEP